MTQNNHLNRRTVMKTLSGAAIGGSLLTGSASARGPPERGRGPKNVVSIEARHPDDGGDHYIFDFSTTEIEPGWTTFILENQSGSTHLAPTVRAHPGTVDTVDTIIDDDGNDIDSRREAQIEIIAKPFQEAFDPYWAGDIDMFTFFDELGDAIGAALLDAWPGEPAELVWEPAVPVGGPGLIQGNHTGRTTMYLEPGVYLMECYVLDEDGVFHTNHMLESFEVIGDESNAAEPKEDAEISINNSGITLHDSIDRPGRYTFGVTFEENQSYGHGLGHDVNLIRLDGDTHIDGEGDPEMDVNIWMNWLDAVPDEGFMYGQRGALTSTSANPGPSTWLGGVQDISPVDAHQRAYFEASLQPGDYALVAEIPDPLGQGFVETFTVDPSGK